MEPNQLTQGIPAESWEMLAKLAKTTPEDLKGKYEALLAQGPQRAVSVAVGEAASDGDCVGRDFNVSLFGIVGISGSVNFCGSSSSDWSATVHLCLDVAGSSVWCTDYTLSPQNVSVCFNPDLAAVKAKLCIGIVGANHCFNVNGNACYWAFGWHCEDFNETLFCFN